MVLPKGEEPCRNAAKSKIKDDFEGGNPGYEFAGTDRRGAEGANDPPKSVGVNPFHFLNKANDACAPHGVP